ncbi:MAG: hypothetical protein JOZ62_15855 [Acidobacteriaceae bacterium]|nr:hypothetical protein [Acidobacteriaceae bacterium]
MQLCYSCVPKLLFRTRKQLILLLCLIALPPLETRLGKAARATPVALTMQESGSTPHQDPRLVRLRSFLARLHCPIADLAPEFIRAADANHLDWRLLPSISLIESSGGKAYRNNNIFGWNNGDQPFESIPAGIHEVAFRLGHSPIYRNRDSYGKLRLYNPDESYASAVIDVMNRISPVVNLRTAPDEI